VSTLGNGSLDDANEALTRLERQRSRHGDVDARECPYLHNLHRRAQVPHLLPTSNVKRYCTTCGRDDKAWILHEFRSGQSF
jgi:hypothetical protein